MQIFSPSISNRRPSRLSLVLIFLFFPVFMFAQSLSGLWTGVMTNDSTSVRKDQSFEIALTEYRGKVYGYSRSEFIVNDTLYYIVKRVKGTIEGDKCEVKDDEIISCNFIKRLDKGVKVTSVFYRNKQDSSWYLAGKWKTNQTKNYYSLTGKVALQEEKDLSKSKIFPHLEELNMTADIQFYNDRKQETLAIQNAIPDNRRFETLIRTEELRLLREESLVGAKPPVNAIAIDTLTVSPGSAIYTTAAPVKTGSLGIPVKTDAGIATVELKEGQERIKTNIKNEEQNTIANSVTLASQPNTGNVSTTTVPVKNAQVIRTNTEPVKNNTSQIPVKTDAGIAKTEIKQSPEKPKNSIRVQEQNTIATNKTTPKELKPEIKQTPTAGINKPTASTIPPQQVNTTAVTKSPDLAVIETKTDDKSRDPIRMRPRKHVDENELKTALTGGRKSEYSQVVNFKSDSLELALYDNGEIDGDTVSVYLNGEILLANQGLKATAIKKTIYITPGNEEFTIVLYAENLGKYPPNTGLLVVHDGEDVYNIRFSADLTKNAGLVFRKKE
jgi:hypothetical protein